MNDDLISRRGAVAKVKELFEMGECYCDKYSIVGALNELPSAEPKKGKWIPVRSYEAFGGDEMMWAVRGNPIAFYYCSNCRNDAYAGEDGESLLTKYCPECGARMEE